jgi:hypothetical protein
MRAKFAIDFPAKIESADSILFVCRFDTEAQPSKVAQQRNIAIDRATASPRSAGWCAL